MHGQRLLPLLATLLLFALALPRTSPAASPADVPCCQHISAAELEQATAIMERQFLYDCCDDTVAACLAEEAQACPVASRVAGEICRRVGAGQDEAAIDQALRLRARSMISEGPAAAIQIEGAPMLGEADAPVVLVEFACLRCPFCSKLTPKLEREILEGKLKGKVRLYYKLFPIKGHEGSAESGIAALAAHAQGQFWAFLGKAYSEFDGFDTGKLAGWASDLGLNMAAYEAAEADPATRQILVDSKREGMALGVSSTPTFFINGRLYHSDLELEQMIDLLEEEYERVTAAR
jgi:protein-disulfide isomerase